MSANSRQVGGDHYKGENADFQHWDLIELFGIGYLEGCATKYVSRWRKKNGLQDVQKARHYIEKLMEMFVAGERRPRGETPLQILRVFFDQQKIDTPEERDTIAMLCRWRTVDDLYLALEFLDRVEKMAVELAASRPGTPEDSGHYELNNNPLVYSIPKHMVAVGMDGILVVDQSNMRTPWTSDKYEKVVESASGKTWEIHNPKSEALRQMLERIVSPNQQEL